MLRLKLSIILTSVSLAFIQCVAGAAAAPDFTKNVAPIFAKYCSGCHNDTDLEGNLSLTSFAKLQKGGEKGAVLIPNRSDASLMIRMLTGEVEPTMPPADNPRPTKAEIDVLRSWIDAGAKGPNGAEPPFPEPPGMKIKPAAGIQSYITALALSPDGKRLALGRYRRVELIDPSTHQIIATTKELPGKVNSISYSHDGSRFVVASGIPALYGVATICKASDGTTITQIKGHQDTLYDAKLSPDGTQLATCSYDRLVNLWDVATGKLVRTFSGHNGAVYEIAFSPDGSVLASASADMTVKLWSVKTGERLDTLGQPEGEQSTVAFTPDGKSILAGGADRQLRLWAFVSRQRAEINPLKFSRTAHDSPIVKLAFSSDGSKVVTASEGRELVLWDVRALTPIHRYEAQPDVVTGIAFDSGTSAGFTVTRINGTWQHYAATGSIKEMEITTTNNVASTADESDEPDMPSEPKRAVFTEKEPNDSPAAANVISTNSVTSGIIGMPAKGADRDADLFRLHAKKGEPLVLEINAARNKSPLDSKLEILDAAGKPIPRVVLQAVRSSYFTFRGHNSTDRQDFRLHGSADMEFNELLYANGEVMRLWMNPRGPDSGWLIYPGFSGDRFTYFGSTAITHALNETCYVVEPHQPGETLIPNGLPQYTLNYENDDDDTRKMGRDSRIVFTAPADGDYLVRVSDVRGFGGNDYKYQLVVREPRPDFQIKITDKDKDGTVNAGSGKEFSVVATRKDEFDGEIRIRITGLPPGFHVTSPLTVEAGQTTAYGVLSADADAPAPSPEAAKQVKVVASAIVNGKQVKKKPMNFGEIKLAARPKLLIHVLPAPVSGKAGALNLSSQDKPSEIVIAPGETIAAVVKVERNGYAGEVKFGTEFAGRNLPHGVYVDNIGLNGMTLLRGETERTFFLTARKWVPEQTRPFHLRAAEEGNQTSWPAILKVQNHPHAPAIKDNDLAAAPKSK